MKKKLKVIVTFSGGKDSLASLILSIKKYGIENIIVVFCDTGWEHPMTYAHIKEIMDHFGIEIVVVSSSKYNGFEDMVKKKKRFPSVKARFCTEELKTKPMIDWLLDVYQFHAIIVQGIRADESTSRSLMSAQCNYFKYYFEPYDRNDWKLARVWKDVDKLLSAKKKVPASKMAELEKLADKVGKGILEPKFYTYRKKDVFKFCEQYADDIERPVFHNTANEVISIILDAGLKPNPLYYLDMGRVGCFPCIMVNKKEMWHIIVNFPWIIDKIRIFEIEADSSFFRPDYVPERYHRQSVWTKKGWVSICRIDDVVRYLTDRNAQGDMFDQEDEEENGSRRCMSVFNICE